MMEENMQIMEMYCIPLKSITATIHPRKAVVALILVLWQQH